MLVAFESHHGRAASGPTRVPPLWEYARPHNFMFMVMTSEAYSFDFDFDNKPSKKPMVIVPLLAIVAAVLDRTVHRRRNARLRTASPARHAFPIIVAPQVEPIHAPQPVLK